MTLPPPPASSICEPFKPTTYRSTFRHAAFLDVENSFLDSTFFILRNNLSINMHAKFSLATSIFLALLALSSPLANAAKPASLEEESVSGSAGAAASESTGTTYANADTSSSIPSSTVDFSAASSTVASTDQW
jgi:hypothetical protein